MPFPLSNAFSDAQRRIIPKEIKTLEDMALTSSIDLPAGEGYEYIITARRHLAAKILERIWREGHNTFVVRVQPQINYPQGYDAKLYCALAIPFINIGSEDNVDHIRFLRRDGRDYSYQIRFAQEREQLSFMKFENIVFVSEKDM